MLDTNGNPTGTIPTGIQVRYTAQDVPISPWLAPTSWTYTLTFDSAWLANLNDGVLDLSVQVMGQTRMQFRPWPAFLHMNRGLQQSALVPIMVGDSLTSMAWRVPGVTRIARSERKESGVREMWEVVCGGIAARCAGGSSQQARPRGCQAGWLRATHTP
jgi:hypothetical protein